MKDIDILKRLWSTYTKHYTFKILLSIFFSILVDGSTSAIAWLLDPAIKKIFIEKDQSLLLIIPLGIILAFTVKGISLYMARAIMISVAEEIKKTLQVNMLSSLINSDTQTIDQKHSGKFISNVTYDVAHITNLLSNAVLNLFKDSLTLIGLLFVIFYQIYILVGTSFVFVPVT